MVQKLLINIYSNLFLFCFNCLKPSQIPISNITIISIGPLLVPQTIKHGLIWKFFPKSGDDGHFHLNVWMIFWFILLLVFLKSIRWCGFGVIINLIGLWQTITLFKMISLTIIISLLFLFWLFRKTLFIYLFLNTKSRWLLKLRKIHIYCILLLNLLLCRLRRFRLRGLWRRLSNRRRRWMHYELHILIPLIWKHLILEFKLPCFLFIFLPAHCEGSAIGWINPIGKIIDLFDV